MTPATDAAITGTGADLLDVPRIMFVDDDDLLLDGLRDAMRPSRRRWEMAFARSGEDAITAIGDHPPDVIVCDLRMPGMDGAALLEHVRRLSPATVRIVLSGHAELRLVARAAGVAHQLLAKPCETERLVDVIARACALKQTIARVELSRGAVGASSLPSVPHLYHELSEVMSSGEATVEEVTRIVEQDIGMAAKVLQLANSAYFGRRQPVSAINAAIAYLGLDAVDALVLQADTFRQFRVQEPIAGFDLERLQRHCNRVGHLARELLGEVQHGSEAFTAGLLHDVGLLIRASQDGERLGRILQVAHGERRPIEVVERAQGEVGHAEIGAHLLSLWGLPFPVTASVSAHHEPPRAGAEFDEASATYTANVLIEEAEARADATALPPSELDPGQLDACGLASRLPRWRELAQAQVEGSP